LLCGERTNRRRWRAPPVFARRASANPGPVADPAASADTVRPSSFGRSPVLFHWWSVYDLTDSFGRAGCSGTCTPTPAGRQSVFTAGPWGFGMQEPAPFIHPDTGNRTGCPGDDYFPESSGYRPPFRAMGAVGIRQRLCRAMGGPCPRPSTLKLTRHKSRLATTGCCPLPIPPVIGKLDGELKPGWQPFPARAAFPRKPGSLPSHLWPCAPLPDPRPGKLRRSCRNSKSRKRGRHEKDWVHCMVARRKQE
jgi:hypothetical protein